MKVTVVGCGALGGLFAARLLLQGHEVQLLQHEGHHLGQLQRRGLVLRGRDGNRRTFRPPVSSSPSDMEPADLVLVTVKAYGTVSVAPELPGLLREEGWAVTLQNGLGNAETLAEAAGEDRVAVGPCTYGAWMDGEGTVHAAGEGELILGPFRKGRDLTVLGNLFGEAGFEVSLRDDPFPPLWEKLVINAGINPLTALARCPNGALPASPDLRELMEALVFETVAVARSRGIFLDRDVSWERCLAVCERTSANRSSMLQDVEAGRLTENEAISGQVVRLAREESVPVPVTENVWRLLRGIDRLAGA